MVVKLGDYEVPLEIIRKNNKNVYFRVKENGILYVTCNSFIFKKEILNMIKSNEKALTKMYEKVLNRCEKSLYFYYLGRAFTKVFSPDVNNVYFQDNMIYVKDEKMFDKWYKNECIRIFNERIDKCLKYFTDIPQFSLRIRSMKTRWGVNNITRRVITLNSELLKKDISLIDYVIVHELCHFYEANHGKKFWFEVEKRYSDYKLARKRLRVE